MNCIASNCGKPAVGTIALSSDLAVGACAIHLIRWSGDNNTIRDEPMSTLKIWRVILRLGWLTSDERKLDPSEASWDEMIELKMDELIRLGTDLPEHKD